MAKDLIYYYDKDTFLKHELGEIQTAFNQNFVIDGSKDSTKVIVFSFLESEIKPLTIIKHGNTNTWWVVDHDKVERYLNENGTFVYKHSLNLLGAKELLNHRDLVGSGFYQKRYTIESFINRLFKHSTFRLPISINATLNLELDNVVDYLKTYTNYTLLSALNDFLNGYNCEFKLNFVEDTTHITSATLDIISKTGNFQITPINISYFDDVRETKTIDKNSHGQNVVSNAENVVSTVAKTFPTLGGAKLSANEFHVTPNNAILRLPSNIYKVNWVDMVNNKVPIVIKGEYSGPGVSGNIDKTLYFSPVDKTDMANCYADFLAYLKTILELIMTSEQAQTEVNAIANDITLASLANYGKYRFNEIIGSEPNESNDYNKPISNKDLLMREDEYHNFYPTGVCDKDLRDCLYPQEGVIYYTRGQRVLNGFKFFNNSGLFYFKPILNEGYGGHFYYSYTVGYPATSMYFNIDIAPLVTDNHGNMVLINEFRYLSWIVNYIPMNDFKIKIDNEVNGIDMQLYNQNGKQTDSNALSKLLLSYSKEITSDNITRYKNFYGTNSIPKVGTLVKSTNDTYVINNVSLTYYPNEEGYYVEGEFSLSKSVAVKSLMVNASRNIRDYGIPQNDNVSRQQVYKDIYSLSYVSSANSGYKLPLSKILNVGFEPNTYQEHMAIMKIEYDDEFGEEGNEKDTYYYQLNTTTYILKKSIYEIVDFKDNNIIGYGVQNVWSGFDIKRILQYNQNDTITTPISYVDTKGEFEKITICFCDNEQIMSIYDTYEELEKQATGYTTWDGVLYNACPFLDSLIYEGGDIEDSNNQVIGTLVGAKDNCDFIIEELQYKKDALEVPVFEYSAQLMDSKDVTIGQNILNSNPNAEFNVYIAIKVAKGKTTENNFHVIGGLYFENNIYYNATWFAVKMEYDSNNKIVLSFYRKCDVANGQPSFVDYMTIDELDLEHYDLAIVRCRKNTDSNIVGPLVETENDLLFILNNAENGIVGNTIELKINYKGS